MPLFRRKAAPPLPRTSSISVYGQGRAQALQKSKYADKLSSSTSNLSIDLDDRPHPLAFAEATFDPALPIKTKSRLSKELLEILHDNAALAYFIQYMDARKAKHLVKFWLETESFRISSETKQKIFEAKPPSESVATDKCDDVFQGSCQSSKFKRVEDFRSVHGPEDSKTLNSDCWNSVSTDGSDRVQISLKDAQDCRSSVSRGLPNVMSDVHNARTFDPRNSDNSNMVSLNSSCANSSSVENPNAHVDNSNSSNYRSSYNSNPPSVINDSNRTLKVDGTCDTLSIDQRDRPLEHGTSVDSGCEIRSKDSVPSVEALNEASVGEIEDQLKGNEKKCEKIKRENALDDGDQSAEELRDGLARLETSTLQDAIAIYSKYIAPDASFPIGITNELKFAIQNEIFKPTSDIDSQCFVPAQDFIAKRMDKEYYPNFLRSSFNCKHQIDVLTSGNVFLSDVLYNDSALFFFMEFMEQECVRHYVDFLLMADNFRKHLLSHSGGYDGMQAQTDAMVLYDKYFSLQATTPLGFSDSVRFELEANICQEKGPQPDCFLKPVKILTQYLEKTYLLQFLSSQLYFKYISECIIIIQSDGLESASQTKPPGSDSGSEQSLPISSINTLLAMDGHKQPGSSKSSRTLDTQDSKMDLLQFKPDDLWQRPLASKLQIAHVDHLGRVTTGFEPPDPDKRKESKISKAVKKLVNWEEDKNQEEMAWKVAEMIVKDICSVTMPESEYPFKAENSLDLQS
ncbi:hypothetical protein JTE90_015355 [Oedothorax gibbosus]|uniref:RGS domain-containing protein n=1 Tax=Oedothorax gibbosus TaxID=931172 RepID=A0AAV6U326_9ARAC|nr:hypothetical protein JTE90_015355 [Oedothorax gibbosus]